MPNQTPPFTPVPSTPTPRGNESTAECGLLGQGPRREEGRQGCWSGAHGCSKVAALLQVLELVHTHEVWVGKVCLVAGLLSGHSAEAVGVCPVSLEQSDSSVGSRKSLNSATDVSWDKLNSLSCTLLPTSTPTSPLLCSAHGAVQVLLWVTGFQLPCTTINHPDLNFPTFRRVLS